jgi:hypothetical protein
MGSDGVVGYIKSDDTVTVVAEVDASGSVDISQLPGLLRIGNYAFDDCEEQLDGRALCTYRQDISSTTLTIFPYVIKLYDQWDNQADRADGTFYVDKLSPTVAVQGVQQAGDVLRLNVNVQDRAYASGASTTCSGLSDLVIYKQQGDILGTVETTGCQKRGMVEVPVLGLGSSGNHVVCVAVQDGVGHNATGCAAVEVDLDKPTISDIRLRSEYAPHLQYIGTQEQGFFSFMVADSNLANVTMDVDGIALDVICRAGDGTNYNCTSNDRTFNPGNYTIQISAEDEAGNIGAVSAGIQLRQDTAYPRLTFLGTDFENNGTVLLSEHTPIIARISETGSGFYKGNVKLRLPTGEAVPADRCTRSTQWECVWEDFDLAGMNGQGYMSLVDSVDDAGNTVISDTEFTSVVVDTEPPQVQDVTFYSLAEGFEAPFGVSNNPLFLYVHYQDASDVMGVADLSVLGGEDMLAGDCVGGLCSFESGPLGVGPAVGDVILNLSDALGNTLTHGIEVELLATANGTTDLWQHTVTISPASVDRSTAEMINNFVYAEVQLATPAQAELVGLDLDGCHGGSVIQETTDDGSNGNSGFYEREPGRSDFAGRSAADAFGDTSSLAFIQEYELVDYGEATADTQFIKFTLKATSYEDVDEINLVCDLRLVSRQGTTFAPQEIEQVQITIPFFANPAGDLGESYQEELDAAIEDATEGILNKIASFEKFVEIARKICEVYNSIWSLIRNLNLVMEDLGISAEALRSIPLFAIENPAQDGAFSFCVSQQGVREEAKGLQKFMQRFCDFVSCRFSLSGWLWNKYGADGEAFDGLERGIQNGPIGKVLGGDFVLRFAKDGEVSGYTDTSESLIWSMVNLCVPGIIKNLNEYRQIKCRYALCLRDDVPAGVPKEACDSMESYMSCKYIYSELFHFFPITAFFESIFSQLKQAFSTPTGAIGFVAGFVCGGLCGPIKQGVPGATNLAAVCSKLEVFKAFGEIISTVTRMFNADYWQIRGEDICDSLEGEDEE